ncbi:MAG: PD-(D/E)XK nuclease family protein [Planctomycetes bacterium]|nr:PD-(D/E)XK nuclease family protein [Planctomycetota bacterium]
MAELRNEFSWSRSRAKMFEDCSRRYWFHYYGSWGGWDESAAPRVREAYILKRLQTRWMWVGDVVHGIVEQVLTGARFGETISEEEAARRGLEKMRRDFRESRERQYRKRPKKACGLFEHEYDSPISDAEWREAADHMKACVGNFYRSPYHAFLPKLPRGSWLPIEELSSFFLDDIKVFVKPDAAFRSGPETVEIIDWKTGRADREADPVQLACYSAYAVEKRWVRAIGDVTTTEYNLATGRALESQMTEERLAQVKVEIRASAAAMREPLDDRERNIAREERFPATTDPRACRGCNFRRICPEAKEG